MVTCQGINMVMISTVKSSFFRAEAQACKSIGHQGAGEQGSNHISGEDHNGVEGVFEKWADRGE